MNLSLSLSLMARGGGAAAPTPATILANVAHWWRADRGITIATGVSVWNDQVGTAHLLQATGANQPAYNASDAAYGNMPTLQSTATSMFLAAAGVTTNQTFTVWFVGQAGTMGNVIFALGAGAPYLVNSANNMAMYAGTSFASAIAANAKHATLATFAGAASYLGVDNWLTGGATGGAGATNGTTVGAFAQSNGSFGSVGKIAEVIIQAGTPTALEKTNMATYFARYGITVT